MRCGQLRGVEGGREIGGDDAVELLGRFGEDVALHRDAGIVDQAIKAAPALHGGGDGRFDLIAAGHVAMDEGGRLAQLGSPLRAFCQHIGQHHPRAFGDQPRGDGEADAAGGPGDEIAAVRKSMAHAGGLAQPAA